jgi:xylulokinase
VVRGRKGALLAGVDLGSTSLKSVIYDLRGNAVASAARPTQRFHPDPAHPSWTVWDPAQIWGGAAAAVHDAVAEVDDPRDIAAVAVTGMGMDGVPVDEHGAWLYPFISWLCPRTAPQRQWWEKTIGTEKTFSVGGNTLWVHSTALRILWMAEHEPDILQRTHKWLLIEDFLNFMLCGREATDYSMASCTLLFDQASRCWSKEMLALSGIDGRLLCDPLPSGAVLGEVTRAAAEATGLPEGTPVVLGGHDYLCGALPVGAFRPGIFLDMSGTWEVVQATIPEPLLSPGLQSMGATVECHVARDMYSAMAAAVSAEMLEWAGRVLSPAGAASTIGAAGAAGGAGAAGAAGAAGTTGGGTDWDALMKEAASSPVGSRGVMFLPHMGGSGSPVVDPQSRGAFAGLGGTATRGDMLRALIEGLDFQLLDMVQAMKKGTGLSADTLVVAGGASRNSFWLQNKADVLGQAIVVPDLGDASPLGAAMLAGIGVGCYRDQKDAFQSVCRQPRTVEPGTAASARYAELFPIYKSLYPALKQVSHAAAMLGA